MGRIVRISEEDRVCVRAMDVDQMMSFSKSWQTAKCTGQAPGRMAFRGGGSCVDARRRSEKRKKQVEIFSLILGLVEAGRLSKRRPTRSQSEGIENVAGCITSLLQLEVLVQRASKFGVCDGCVSASGCFCMAQLTRQLAGIWSLTSLPNVFCVCILFWAFELTAYTQEH